MVKLTTFEILVDNRGAVVKAGDTLRGHVMLELSGDMDVIEIRISFTGCSQVRWAGPHSQSSSPMAEVQGRGVDQEQAEEVYLNQVLILFPLALPEGGGRPSHVMLSQGQHLYAFEFDVPASCPHSFTGLHGVTRYMLRAVVERAWKVDFNSRPITVHSELDLNNLPEARDAVDLSADLHIHSLFFRSGDCHATLRLPRKGFTPGDIIPAEFYVNNGSHQELHKVSLHLRMTVIYRAGTHKCTMEVALAKVVLGKVPAGKTLEGRDRGLRVPHNCPPSGLPGCALISVHYRVELKIKPALLSLKRLKITTDIIVGTTSLETSRFEDNPPDYWSCCPPSYEDVVSSSQWMLSLPSPSTPTHIPPPSITADPPSSPVTASSDSLSTPVSPSGHPLSPVTASRDSLSTPDSSSGHPLSPVTASSDSLSTPVTPSGHPPSSVTASSDSLSTPVSPSGHPPSPTPGVCTGLSFPSPIPTPSGNPSSTGADPGLVVQTLRRPILVNDEPRVTVLRQGSSPLTDCALVSQPRHPPPLLRPRANTGPPPRTGRARGR